MKEIDSLVLLSEKTSFQSYLEAELRKKFKVHHFGKSDISVVGFSNFISVLALLRPCCIIYLLSSYEGLNENNFGSYVQRALIGTEATYLEVRPLNYGGLTAKSSQKPYSALVRTLFIELGLVHSFRTKNLITDFLEKVKDRRKITLKEESNLPLISERMAAKYLSLFLNKAFLKQDLNGTYQLCENGFPHLSEVFEEALKTASVIAPDNYKAKLVFSPEEPSKAPYSFDNTQFQMDSELILGDWRDGVIETASGWVSEHIN